MKLPPEKWIPIAQEICRQHNIVASKLTPYTNGSNWVASADGKTIVKIFPDLHRHQWESERRALKHLEIHTLSVPIPKLLAEGKLPSGETYVLMTQLPGESLEVVWPKLDLIAKAQTLNQIGALMAEAHQIPVGSLSDLAPNWSELLKKQIQNCRSRHEKLEMPKWFLNSVESYLEGFTLPKKSSVILTGEYTPFNLLVDASGKIRAMIDFGDVLIGHPEYDLVGPCTFLGEGNPKLIRSLFEGYGISLDSQIRKRVLALSILHRYSDLKSQIRIPDWMNRVGSFEELENLVLPI
ncbi:aminoglycoside phosphotransferase family protein [bacterium]|jgi:hygromycin-B 7''-O-kinase|nr:aminoglycoside phosphotransferase family protein [bacterium]